MARYDLTRFIVVIGAISAIFVIQFLTPTLYGADGYLHIRMAEFLKEFGPRYDFHWARFSTFSSHFADKDFLYHVALIPFTFFPNIFFGAKLAAVCFASFLFLGFYVILKRYSRDSILPFFLIAFLLSHMFLNAISRPRPISLVILMTIFSIYFLIEKKFRLIFFISVIYALSHVTSPLLIVYALIVEIVRYSYKKEFCFKSFVYTFGGILTGFIIHPNFPNNFLVFYLNSVLVPIYTIKTGVLELGVEFFPLNTREFLLSYPVIIIGLILLIYVSISKRPKASFHTSAFLALAMFFFVLSFICRRYLLHGYPIMLIAFASYFSDAMIDMKKINRKTTVFASILIIILALNCLKNVHYNAFVARIVNTHYEVFGRWMEENIPEGELVFHANWSDSQYFIGLNPKNDYFVTLDPVYMYKEDPELYRLYRDVSFGRTKDPYVILKDTFKARYGYVGKNYFMGLVGQIKDDGRFSVLKEDAFGLIFRLS